MTVTPVTQPPRPTTTTASADQDLARRLATGIPFGVNDIGGDAIAFQMRTTDGPVALVWDRANDALLVGGKAAPPDVRNAVLGRLEQSDLAATRKGSTYDRMRQDMFASSPAITAPKAALAQPPLPKPPDAAPTLPTTATPSAATTAPAARGTGGETDALYAKASMTREEFVEQMGTKSIAAGTAIPGVEVGRADLNADGVVAGKAEMSALFSEIEKRDRNRDPNVADLTNAGVKKAMSAATSAADAGSGRARYSKAALAGMSEALDSGTPLASQASFVKAGTKDYLGRKLGADAVDVWVSEGAGKGVSVVHDRRLGFFKSGETGALVPMTAADMRDFKKDMTKPGDDASAPYKVLWNRMFPKDAVVVSEECDY